MKVCSRNIFLHDGIKFPCIHVHSHVVHLNSLHIYECPAVCSDMEAELRRIDEDTD